MITNAIICTTFPSAFKNSKHQDKVKSVPCYVNLETLEVKIDKEAEDILFAPVLSYQNPNSLYCEVGNQFCTVAGGQNERVLDDECEGFKGFMEEINNPTSNFNKIQMLKAELFVNQAIKNNNLKKIDKLNNNTSFYIDDEQTVIDASTLSNLTTEFSKLSLLNEDEAKQLKNATVIFDNIAKRLKEDRKKIIDDNIFFNKREKEILSEIDSLLISDFSIENRNVYIFNVSIKRINDYLDSFISILDQKEIKHIFSDCKNKLIFIDPSQEYDLRDVICENMKNLNIDSNLKSFIKRDYLFSHNDTAIKLLYS